MFIRIALICLIFTLVSAYNNGMGETPPMGWNTWCTDDICGLRDICTEKEIKSIADAIVEQGLDKLGYKYVNLDDCWSDTQRDENGDLQPNAQQFPNGMKALADYVHSKGLYLGIYTCIGTLTCKRGRPGLYGHFEQDAKRLASWGIDLVKTDNCHHPSGVSVSEHELFTNFSRALNATGRPILFSLCEWGNDNVEQWGADVAQMYRIQMDHLPLWYLPTHAAGKGVGQGTVDIINYVKTLKPSQITKQYGYIDPDFLETLFPITMSFIDSRTEFSFWSLWSAPLIVATDLRNLSHKKRAILTNEEVIAIDQDRLFKGGDFIKDGSNGGQIWSKDLLNGDKCVILFNDKDWFHTDIKVEWSDIGWNNTDNVKVRDLWEKKDLGSFAGGFEGKKIAPHDVIMIRLTKVSQEVIVE